jgi:hypothetical protein
VTYNTAGRHPVCAPGFVCWSFDIMSDCLEDVFIGDIFVLRFFIFCIVREVGGDGVCTDRFRSVLWLRNTLAVNIVYNILPKIEVGIVHIAVSVEGIFVVVDEAVRVWAVFFLRLVWPWAWHLALRRRSRKT